jgi:carboxymethylenebutenolidase
MVAPVSGLEVNIPRSDGPPTPGYASLPYGAERGVVVIHELFGRQPEIDRVVDRFASAGYAAVGPDLFAGRSKPACIRRALTTISTGEGTFAEQLAEAKRWLSDEAKLDERRIGVIGFCIGGGLALAVGRRFAAVSSNYGDLPPDEILRESPPIIACYGGRDRIFRRNGERLRERLRVLGRAEPEVHNYASVGHSFLTDGRHPIATALSWPLFHIRYHPAVAEDAWGKILGFFERTL